MKKSVNAVLVFIFLIFAPIVYSADYVVPSGQTVGIKIYTDGLTVTEISSFRSSNGEIVCPAAEADIQKGDTITAINGVKVNSYEEFCDICAGTPISFTLRRSGENITASVTPVTGEDNLPHIGIWVRDSTAGVGTLTCVNPQTGKFNALGHAITDIDTGNIMTVKQGNIQKCEISSVSAGHIGFPGSISAIFLDENLGQINVNTVSGISGIINTPPSGVAVEVAAKAAVSDGGAHILSDVCQNGVESFSVNVKKLSDSDEKNMIIEITDERLLNVTGGIVQGMSGCPIIQNGKLIGALTHVFVNNPKCGYAIFAENMPA